MYGGCGEGGRWIRLSKRHRDGYGRGQDHRSIRSSSSACKGGASHKYIYDGFMLSRTTHLTLRPSSNASPFLFPSSPSDLLSIPSLPHLVAHWKVTTGLSSRVTYPKVCSRRSSTRMSAILFPLNTLGFPKPLTFVHDPPPPRPFPIHHPPHLSPSAYPSRHPTHSPSHNHPTHPTPTPPPDLHGSTERVCSLHPIDRISCYRTDSRRVVIPSLQGGRGRTRPSKRKFRRKPL